VQSASALEVTSAPRSGQSGRSPRSAGSSRSPSRRRHRNHRRTLVRRGAGRQNMGERPLGSADMDRCHTNSQDAGDPCRTVAVALAALSRRQQVALVQRRYHGLTYAEIATALHCSKAGARASVYAALRTPREHIGDRL
jgi:DNA-directed RNA polymerase specialized sigma24 family protein